MDSDEERSEALQYLYKRSTELLAERDEARAEVERLTKELTDLREKEKQEWEMYVGELESEIKRLKEHVAKIRTLFRAWKAGDIALVAIESVLEETKL